MNGNQLANVLDNPVKDFKDFSTEDWTGVMGKARRLAGPEGEVNINFPKDRRDLASEIDKILNSKDYLMLGPEDRAKVIKILQGIQTAKEKSSVEMATAKTTTGKATTARTTKKEEPAYEKPRPQGVQFRRVDGELVREEADKWWEELTPEQKIAKRKAELEGSEYFRKRALEREHPELKIPIETRELGLKKEEFEYKKEKETAEFKTGEAEKLQEQLKWEEEKRLKRDELFEDKRKWTLEFGADEATRMFDEKIRLFEYEDDKKDTDRQYKLDVEKFGEEKAENIRQYNLDTAAEKHSWSELLYQRGFKNKEFIEKSKEFWGILDFNKTKEETRATEFGLTHELDVTKEADIMEDFVKTLKLEYEQLDLDIKKHGLNVETEERIHTLGVMNVALKTKELGLEEAKQYFEEREAERTEWWNKKDYELKDKNANRLLKETEARIINDARETDLKTAIHRENIRQFDKETQSELDKEAEEGVDFTLDIPPEFATTLSNMGEETQSEVMRLIKLTYDPKKGKNVYPNKSDRKTVTEFLIGGEDEEVEKNRLGCNLSLETYIGACLSYYDWTDEMRAYALRLRTDDVLWRGVISMARGSEVLEEDVEGKKSWAGGIVPRLGGRLQKVGEAIKDWWSFGKEKPETEKTTPTNFSKIKAQADIIYDKNNSMAEVERFLTTQGMTLDEYRSQLRAQ